MKLICKFTRLIFISSVLIVLTACNFSGSDKTPTTLPNLAIQGPVPSATKSMAATAVTSPGASQTPVAQAPEIPGIVSASPALPTFAGTQQPTRTAIPRLPGISARIYFDTATTSSIITGTLIAGQSSDYFFYGLANQALLARLTTDNPGTVSLLDVDGNTLPAAILSSNGTFVRTILPSAQNYFVEVTAGGKNINYTLTITIPSRITLNKGTTFESEDGLILNRTTVSYILRGLKDQTLTVSVSSGDGSMVLNIYGLEDDSSLVKASATRSTWTGKLPSTQDYVIDVVPYIHTATFTLDVTIK